MRSGATAWALALAACEAEGQAGAPAGAEPGSEAAAIADAHAGGAPPGEAAAPTPAGGAATGEAAPPSHEPTTAATAAPAADVPLRPLVTRTLRSTALTLALAPDGTGQLWLERAGAEPTPIPCDRLTGAWGLWIDDVDDDGSAEALVALHKPARHDPAPHNRLHVYGFEEGRCVPAWRGTRLVGRFDGVATDPADRGAIVAHEWLSPTRRRVARYRWRGFGYTVERVLWEGTEPPPAALVRALDFGPSPYPRSSPAADPSTSTAPSSAGDP